jgi:hypothetical protein
MKAQEARTLGKQIAGAILGKEKGKAFTLLQPVLDQRTPFRLLDIIGEAVGTGPLPVVRDFLEQIAAGKTEGGWVVIATALRQQMDQHAAELFDHCRKYIIAADIWYATDIFGEWVQGPGLVRDFDYILKKLGPWRYDPNRWVRRTTGVAVHFWTKRSRGAAELKEKAAKLLNFLEPMFEEREIDAVKGISWALKTLGRYYPELVTQWVAEQVLQRQRPHRALMVRKALKFLSREQRHQALGGKN